MGCWAHHNFAFLCLANGLKPILLAIRNISVHSVFVHLFFIFSTFPIFGVVFGVIFSQNFLDYFHCLVWVCPKHKSKFHGGYMINLNILEQSWEPCMCYWISVSCIIVLAVGWQVYSVSEGFQVRATKLGSLPLSCLTLARSADAYPVSASRPCLNQF